MNDPFIRSPEEALVAERAERLASVFAERAAEHDLEGSFPFENFEQMRREGYLKLTVPAEFGGEECSLYEMVLSQERIARGDGSTALAVGWHVGLMLHLRTVRSWPAGLFQRLCQDVVQHGAMINSFASEPATGSPSRGGKPQTTAGKTDGGWIITGRKTFSTLSPILDQFIVTATIENTDSVAEFLVKKDERVRIEETWNTLGMRATGSHDVILDRVFVPDNRLITDIEQTKKRTVANDGAGWLLHIPACYLGIAFAARQFAIRFADSYRPNSLPGPIADLPHIQQQIGQMEEELIIARTFLYSVADRWDRDPDGRPALKADLGIAKKLATNSALDIVDKAMRIVGGASLSRTLPLERYYRDVRAGLHNPPMEDSVTRSLADRALREVRESE